MGLRRCYKSDKSPIIKLLHPAFFFGIFKHKKNIKKKKKKTRPSYQFAILLFSLVSPRNSGDSGKSTPAQVDARERAKELFERGSMYGGDSEKSTPAQIDARARERAKELFESGSITEEEYDKIIRHQEEYHQADDLVFVDEGIERNEKGRGSGKKGASYVFSLFPTSPRGQLVDTRAARAVRAATKAREKQTRMKQKVDGQRQEQVRSDVHAWRNVVLPSWSEESINSPSVRELCSRGIPPSIRGEIWGRMIGNRLNITRDLWRIHEKRGGGMVEVVRRRMSSGEEESITKQPRTSSSSSSSGSQGSQAAAGSAGIDGLRDSHSKDHTVVDIDVDVPRTFPELEFFHDGGEWEDRLRALLVSYCSYRPDIGYIQGMSFPAAILLLYMESYEAFVALANLLSSQKHFSLNYSPELHQDHIMAFKQSFKANLPLLFGKERSLFSFALPLSFVAFCLLCANIAARSPASPPILSRQDHFNANGVTHELYLIDWRLSIFCRILPLDTCARVWDNFLREGETYIIRCSLGILKTLAKRLAKTTELGQIVKMLREGLELEDTEVLMENIEKMRAVGMPGFGRGRDFCAPS